MIFLLKHFGVGQSFSWGLWYPCFEFLVTSYNKFQNLSLAYYFISLKSFPQIHLWYDAYQPLSYKRDYQASMTHLLFQALGDLNMGSTV